MEVLVIAVLIGLIPAAIAKGKGRSFGLWLFYGAALFIIALSHALIMKADNPSRLITQWVSTCFPAKRGRNFGLIYSGFLKCQLHSSLDTPVSVHHEDMKGWNHHPSCSSWLLHACSRPRAKALQPGDAPQLT